MTRPKSANDLGVDAGCVFKVRITIGPAVIHVLSRSEPVVHRGRGPGAGIVGVELDVVADSEHGDVLGFVRWSAVDAIAWRRAADRKHREPRVQAAVPALDGGDAMLVEALRGDAMLVEALRVPSSAGPIVAGRTRARARDKGGDCHAELEHQASGRCSDPAAERRGDERVLTFPPARGARRQRRAR